MSLSGWGGQNEFDGDSHCQKIECQVCIEPGETAAASLILFHFGEPTQRKNLYPFVPDYFGEIHSKATFCW